MKNISIVMKNILLHFKKLLIILLLITHNIENLYSQYNGNVYARWYFNPNELNIKPQAVVSYGVNAHRLYPYSNTEGLHLEKNDSYSGTAAILSDTYISDKLRLVYNRSTIFDSRPSGNYQLYSTVKLKISTNNGVLDASEYIKKKLNLQNQFEYDLVVGDGSGLFFFVKPSTYAYTNKDYYADKVNLYLIELFKLGSAALIETTKNGYTQTFYIPLTGFTAAYNSLLKSL